MIDQEKISEMADAIATQYLLVNDWMVEVPRNDSIASTELILMGTEARGRTKTVKAGNMMRVPLAKFLTDVGAGSVPIVTALANLAAGGPFLWVLALFVGVGVATRGAWVELRESEAILIWAWWTHAQGQTLGAPAILSLTNQERSAVGLPEVSQGEIERSLNALVRLGCVGLTKLGYTLQESVRIQWR